MCAEKKCVNGYPYGMTMPGRSYSSGSQYRYGFQGQEKDDEIAGSGNSYTAEFWQYDSRLGRRWNTDPIVKPHESPYATFANNPIWFVDPLGSDTTITGNPDEFDFDCLSCELEDETVTFQHDPTVMNSGNTIWNTTDYQYHEGNDYFEQGWYSEDMQDYLDLDYDNGQVMPATKWYTMNKVRWIEDPENERLGWRVDTEGYLMEDEYGFEPVDITGMIPGGNAGKVGKYITMGARGSRLGVGFKTVQVLQKSVTGSASLKRILPSWKKIKIDVDHIVSGHTSVGSRHTSVGSRAAQSGKKTVFGNLNSTQVEKLVRDAYKNVSKKLSTQGNRIKVRGSSGGYDVDMWVNKATNTIETAYPIR